MKPSFSISVTTFRGSDEEFESALRLLEQRIMESNIVEVRHQTEEALKPIVELRRIEDSSTPAFQLFLDENTRLTMSAGGTNRMIMRNLASAFRAAVSDLSNSNEADSN